MTDQDSSTNQDKARYGENGEADAATFLAIVQKMDDITSWSALGLLNAHSLHYLEDHQQIVRIDKKDVDPVVAEMAKDKDGKDLPIYVVPNVGDEKGLAWQATLDNGQKVVLVNEGLHPWNEAYVRDHIMLHEKALSEDIKNGKYETGDSVRNGLAQAAEHSPEARAQLKRYDEIVASVNENAHSMGVANPELLVDPGSPLTDEHAATRETAEGKNYIFIDKDRLKAALQSDTEMSNLKNELAHEVAHLKDRDMSASGLLQQGGDLAVERYEELKADLTAGGPEGMNNPKAMAQTFKSDLRHTYANYMRQEHPGEKIKAHPSDKELRKAADALAQQDPQHPYTMDRIHALEDEAKRKGEYEKKFKKENGHLPTSPAEKEAETQWLVQKVMKDMEGKWQLPMKEPGADMPEPAKPGGESPKSEDPKNLKRIHQPDPVLSAQSQVDGLHIKDTLAQMQVRPAGGEGVNVPHTPDARQPDAAQAVQRA